MSTCFMGQRPDTGEVSKTGAEYQSPKISANFLSLTCERQEPEAKPGRNAIIFYLETTAATGNRSTSTTVFTFRYSRSA